MRCVQGQYSRQAVMDSARRRALGIVWDWGLEGRVDDSEVAVLVLLVLIVEEFRLCRCRSSCRPCNGSFRAVAVVGLREVLLLGSSSSSSTPRWRSTPRSPATGTADLKTLSKRSRGALRGAAMVPFLVDDDKCPSIDMRI